MEEIEHGAGDRQQMKKKVKKNKEPKKKIILFAKLYIINALFVHNSKSIKPCRNFH